MKKILILLITIFMMFCTSSFTYAQEEEESEVSQWNYQMLLGSSDQDENVRINMFYSMLDRDKHAFCIEPQQAFKPKSAEYTRTTLDDKYIYQVVKAYEKIGLDDSNYYIAAQLLIWKEITNEDYTFDGNDYGDYKEELISIVDDKNLLMDNNNSPYQELEMYTDEEGFIEGDFSDYVVSSDDVQILESNENGLRFTINDEEPEIKEINIFPKDNDDNHSVVLRSETSQDIYYFDGEYSDLKPFDITIKTLKRKKFIDINYSKKDENGNNITGAKFSVYEIVDEQSNEDLVFIKNGKEINIFDALLDDSLKHSKLRIETSERYARYINGNTIKTNEIGYFPYKIYDDDILIKQGICYVSNDELLTSGSYKKYATRSVFKGNSEDLQVNTITDLPANKTYLLCESEPKNGYTYNSEPCVLVNGQEYDDEVFEFTNSTRKYTLKLIKQSPDYIPLDGAVFDLKYQEDGLDKQVRFVTGSLLIPRVDNNKYLIYKHETEKQAKIVEFNGDYFTSEDVKEGKYYYYQSNDNVINNELLNNNYVNVVKGGLCIDNLPYSSSLTLEEIKPPVGFILDDDPIFHITPDIPYCEITLKNYRVNNIDIIPEKVFKIPETCVD